MTAVEERTGEAQHTILRDEMLHESVLSTTRAPDTTWPRTLGRVLVALALLMAWAASYLTVLSGFSEARAQKGLYARLRTELAQGTAPVATPIPAGAPIAVLDIPAVGIRKLVIVEGTAAQQLQDGPGHLSSSPLPGQTGISVVMGRSLSYGAVFAEVHRLSSGDPITVTTGQGRFTYRVTDEPRTGGVLKVPDTTTAMLTLVTSTGSGWLGGVRPSSAVYVDAVLTGTPQVPSVAPPTASSNELPMHGDRSFRTFASLVLALQLLGVVLAAMTWARTHWSPTLAHVLGLPALLASLWLASEFAVRLLPNLM